MRLVLASESPARLRVLRQAGFDPHVVVSHVAEDGVEGLDTPGQVAALAARKAAAVAGRPEAAASVVVACDSLLDLDGSAHGKPGEPAVAVGWWRAQRGRSASLFTGHHVIDVGTGRCAAAVASTVVRFGRPTDDEIAAYVASGEPLGVAGGFTIDGRGAPFVDGVDGDPSNVLGLSLCLLRRLLADLDIEITTLWS